MLKFYATKLQTLQPIRLLLLVPHARFQHALGEEGSAIAWGTDTPMLNTATLVKIIGAGVHQCCQ